MICNHGPGFDPGRRPSDDHMPIDHFEQLVTCIFNGLGIGSGDDPSNIGWKETADFGL
jgi:hypothetical protein